MASIESHVRAVKELEDIRNKALELIRQNKTEKQVAEAILKEYKARKLKTKDRPIVSFGKSTCEMHHKPGNNRLKKGPIMMDIWAKQPGGCYADLTFMFYKGNPDKKFIYCFNELINSRNKALEFLKKCLKEKYLPTMVEIDSISRSYLAEKRLGYSFLHRVGHALGAKVHADNKKGYYARLKINHAYTLEPGIYLKEFGIRLENDFWIDEKFRLHTTEIQNKLIILP